MNFIIRENVPGYMQELKQWLAQTKDVPLEDMSGFFTARLTGYEDHMAVWAAAYKKLPEYMPEDCEPILDLGCGTGLELDRIFERWPRLDVTGIDLCPAMLERLREKHKDKNLTLRCENYLTAQLPAGRYGAVISVESLHHFTRAQKGALYDKIFNALKPGGIFLEADYIACCEEEEQLLQKECARRRAQGKIPKGSFVHFDTPLTLENELSLLREAGFADCKAIDSIAGAVFVRGLKR